MKHRSNKNNVLINAYSFLININTMVADFISKVMLDFFDESFSPFKTALKR